jgi:uncharacterized protein (TIGR00288 family)
MLISDMPSSNSDSPTESIALLIDADNAPARKIEFIMTELARHGVVNIRKAYGNWKKPGLAGWERVLHEYAIQPVQHFDLVKGKNATDMGLLIDAMDILYTKSVDTFCLVSSDSDFTPLVHRLRADGKEVIGFGEQKTPEPFVNGCTHFLYLEDAKKPKSKPVTRAERHLALGNELKRNSKLMNALRSAIDAAADDGWAPLGPVGGHLGNQGPFDHRTYGFSKLSDLFAAIDLFEVERSNIGAQTRIRLR